MLSEKQRRDKMRLIMKAIIRLQKIFFWAVLIRRKILIQKCVHIL